MTYDPLIWLKVTSLSSTASKRKGVKNQENGEFLMIQPTRISHFGARIDGNIKLGNVFLMKKVIEVAEVVEAVEVLEATKVSDARKSHSV